MEHSKLGSRPAAMTTDEIEALVLRAKAQDEAAMTELIQKTSASVFRFLLFLGGSRELAQDLVQETYLYALENIGSLKRDGAFPKWLLLIAKNKFLDHKRGRGNQPYKDLDDVAHLHTSTREQQALYLQAKEVFAKLPEDDRMVILLVDLEGHTYGEAAEALGISESALLSRLYRARQRFQEIFKKG